MKTLNKKTNPKAMIFTKLHFILEFTFLGFIIKWQPFFGVLASVCASIYYISIMKVNVIDKKHNGLWKNYFKSIFKSIK